MTKLRRYLERMGKGAVADLAEATGLCHSHISRIADGHKRASLETALMISEITGIAPRDLLPLDKVNTPKAKKARSGRGAR